MTKHDEIAERLAEKFRTKYHENKGVDLTLPDKVVEVETFKNSLDQGVEQLQGSTKLRYLAVSKRLEKEAISKVEGTGVGVMSEFGKVLKRASSK